MDEALPSALLLAAAYLLGSIPFSYLVARARGVDVRKVGSGNVGATNVMRSAGRAAGLLAFLLDFAKGSAAVLLARAVAPQGSLPAWSAVAAVLGHMYPVWLRFRGGKGVATGLGVFLAVAPVAALVAVATYGAVVGLTRISSAGSLSAAAALLVAMFATGRPAPILVLGVAALALVVLRHRGNIARLIRGKEGRL